MTQEALRKRRSRQRQTRRAKRGIATLGIVALLVLGFASAGALARGTSLLDTITGTTDTTATDTTVASDSTSTADTSTAVSTSTADTSTTDTTATDTTATDTTTTTGGKGPKGAAGLAPAVVNAVLPSSVQLYQWATDGSGWITGNLGSHNSSYTEGQTIPFRLDVSSIPAGSYLSSICRDFTSAGDYGYLKLLPFNTDLSTGDAVTSTVGAISGSSGITLITASDTGAQGSCNAGQVQYDFGFTTDGTASQFIYWGGYLAKPGDAVPFPGSGTVPLMHSAGFYPGSSLHMVLVSPAKDRSINPGSINVLSAITVQKFFDGGATPTSFCFNISPNPSANTPNHQCTGPSNIPGSVQFLDLPSGTYSVTEEPQTGYIFNGTDANDLNCTFTTSTGSAVVVSSTNPQFATCDFHNKSKASPTLGTTPSAGGNVGTALNDSANLAGGSSPTGSITFNLWGPNNATCDSGVAAAVYTQTVTVSGNGIYSTTPGFTTTAPGTYNWTASYTGDGNNNSASSGCGSESVVITKATPGLSTTPSAGVTVGGNVSDVAHLTGGVAPAGTITYNLYGPTDATCASAPVFTDTQTAAGDGNYTSANYAATAAGTYHWRVSFTDTDGNNNSVGLTACADESVLVGKATPGLSTTPSAGVTVGGNVSDVAHLTGGVAPAGTITYNLYGPTDATCASAPVFTDTQTAAGDGNYTSANYAATAAGTYHWRVSFTDTDGNNNSVGLTACADESVLVGKATPGLSTTPSAGVTVGGNVSDVAHLTGGVAPAGTITYNLYGPTDATCASAPVFTDTQTAAGDGNYTSANYAATAAGTYHWRVSFTDTDGNNNSVGLTACADESVLVGKATPGLSTTPSAGVTVGGNVSDVAHLTGGVAPAGTITYNLYGPTDATCASAPVFTDTQTAAGDGNYTSANYAATAAGTYHWRVSFTDTDGNNNSVGLTACADESVLVGKATPGLSTTPSAGVTVGGNVSDVAHLTGGVAPAGTITYNLYGPTDATCASAPVFTDTQTAAGDGNYTSANYAATAAGTYHWRVSFTDTDGNNNSVGLTACADESVLVGKATPSVQTQLSSDGAVSIGTEVADSATLTGATSDVGGTISYALYSSPDCSVDSKIADLTPDPNALVDGKAPDSNPYTFGSAGTFYFQATYSGDTNNAGPVSSDCISETQIVNPNQPTIGTTPSAGGNVGVVLNDSALFAGATHSATGAITFKLFGPNNATCNPEGAAPVYTQTVGVDGDGTYTTLPGYATGAAGMYRWVASYAPGNDPNNLGVTSGCSDEQVTVTNPPFTPPPPPPPPPVIDLQITKTGSPSPTTTGTNITWTMVVKNNGPDTATGVNVADPLPAGTTFVSVATTQGTCAGGALITCQLGTIANGASVTITLVTTATTAGTDTNTATVVGNEQESNTANNTASAQVVVNTPPGVFKPPKPPAPVYCAALMVSPKSLFAGRHAVLTMKVFKHAKPVAGIKVRINGGGLLIVTRATNSKGVVKRGVLPKKAGIVTFRPVAQKSCKNIRIGVIGVFTPPVTG